MYEYITNNNGSVVGNYSLQLTAADANTVQGKLPSSFDAAALLDDGTYTAVYTYFPTPNFTQPSPLTITFQITVRPLLSWHLYPDAQQRPVKSILSTVLAPEHARRSALI